MPIWIWNEHNEETKVSKETKVSNENNKYKERLRYNEIERNVKIFSTISKILWT